MIDQDALGLDTPPSKSDNIATMISDLSHTGDLSMLYRMEIADALTSLSAALGVKVGDQRPLNCRFRLQDEGKAYPRSSCRECGKGITTGLGKQCNIAARAALKGGV